MQKSCHSDESYDTIFINLNFYFLHLHLILKGLSGDADHVADTGEGVSLICKMNRVIYFVESARKSPPDINAEGDFCDIPHYPMKSGAANRFLICWAIIALRCL